MAEISYTNPIFLWFLFTIPLLIVSHFFILKHLRRRAMAFANFEAIERVTGKRILTKNIPLLTIRMFTLAFLILSVAGTTFWYVGETSEFSYVLVIDASSSMLADDFEPNRLEAAKQTALMFLDSVSAKTKIGVVSFSGISDIKLRPSADAEEVRKAIENVTISPVGGTDIGEALITAANLLLGEEEARVIILLTDGRDNVGTPVENGINYVNNYHIVVHTIGVATEAGGRFVTVDILSKLDEETLKLIATTTEGMYFKAENVDELKKAYEDIISVTKKKIPVELAMPFLIIALCLIFLEWGLINTKYRTLP